MPGKWNQEDRASWFAKQVIQRSYKDDVLSRIDAFKASRTDFTVVQYGALSLDTDKYPVFAFRSVEFDSSKRSILVTGGVHGYETSGVMGALQWIEQEGAKYSGQFNIVVAPCVSPWGYETINRWNNNAVDPNRNFLSPQPDGVAEEPTLLMAYLSTLSLTFICHIDLHETTDTDATVFCPTKALRDGYEFSEEDEGVDSIPDGFYLCGNTVKPAPAFNKAVIESVRKVTHIAPNDRNNCIIGTKIDQEGVILYPVKELGLCISMTDADYATTTEVYPDSKSRVCSPEECNRAQVASVNGGLDFILTL
jgi:hypothetical protein